MEAEVIKLSDNEVFFLQNNYSSLRYDLGKNIITGYLEFAVQYKDEVGKKLFESITDKYQIEIDLNYVTNGIPIVKETKGRILDLAKQKKINPADLHIDRLSGKICIIIPPEAKERYPRGFNL